MGSFLLYFGFNTSLSVPIDFWETPSKFPSLQAGELHIWRCHIQKCDLAALTPILSSDETSHADRYYFPKDRASYIACRGTLRSLLGKYLNSLPSLLEFQYSPYGKPSLAEKNKIGRKPIQFNLSHSSDFSLFGFTLDREIGIDVEFIRPKVVEEEIAERFFSPMETRTLRSLPADQQAEAFFRCWTRKEAFIKARGDGLSLPLDQFDVSLGPDEPAVLLRTAFDPQEASRWSLYHLNVEEGYSAAVVIEGSGHAVKLFSLY